VPATIELWPIGEIPAFAQGCPGKLGAAIFVPPPVPKAHLRHVRGGRTERHGLSSPIATSNAAADRRAKSDGVPRWGCLSHPRPITPTRCVQRLRSAVGVAVRSAMADVN